jgi:hypothetical protein
MTILSLDKLTAHEMFPRERADKKLASSVLLRTIEIFKRAPKVPAEVLARIEEIKQAPINEIDEALRDLISLAHDPALFDDTAELPTVLTDAIHDSAEMMVTNWETADFNLLAVNGLTEAAVITNDPNLAKKVVGVVHENPDFSNYLFDVEAAVLYSAQAGTSFVDSMAHITEGQPSIEEAIRKLPPKPISKEQPVPQVSSEEYEDLFHPTIRRPRTPVYGFYGLNGTVELAD